MGEILGFGAIKEGLLFHYIPPSLALTCLFLPKTLFFFVILPPPGACIVGLHHHQNICRESHPRSGMSGMFEAAAKPVLEVLRGFEILIKLSDFYQCFLEHLKV